MSPKIKICGVTREQDVITCTRLGVHFVGFNLWPGSPRHITADAARALAQHASVPVAVCVWTDPSSVQAARDTGFAWIQVHDTPPGWSWPGDHTIVRALRATQAITPELLVGGDYFLIDTPSASVGGSGRTFDWSLLDDVHGHEAMFVAGGLTPDNVAAAVAATKPHAVDVASGVESAPGIKDEALIEAFVDAARGESP